MIMSVETITMNGGTGPSRYLNNSKLQIPYIYILSLSLWVQFMFYIMDSMNVGI